MLMDIAGCHVLYAPDIELMVKADVRGALTMDIIKSRAKYIVVVKLLKIRDLNIQDPLCKFFPIMRA
ncbi:MAG: hypothetical protein GX129_06735 [Clostridiales bacterium]|jgi:hypothetical protein|nr:hypothetical protein [Clostridiales bacterium]